MSDAVPSAEALERFIAAATWHGGLETADSLLAEHPGLARADDIHVAAILGDAGRVRRLVAADADLVRRLAPPHGAEPLVLLCLSKYLRLRPERSGAFLEAAALLLDAGADANGGFTTRGAHPEHETALYGAAGVAHHEAMTRLLLAHGADPNDGEVVYHSPETFELGALKALVETGKLTRESLVLMLIRKHDWHDYEGVKYLLANGAAANGVSRTGRSPLHHAIQRDNHGAIVELLLQHGADPWLERDGISAVARAARCGRGDLLAQFERSGFAVQLEGLDGLLAACARADLSDARARVRAEPELLAMLRGQGGASLGRFSLTDNGPGVHALLELGVPVDSAFPGDGYFQIAPGWTSLQVAAWMLRLDAGKQLIAHGADPLVQDVKGRTPLDLARASSTDSYWTERASPEWERLLGPA